MVASRSAPRSSPGAREPAATSAVARVGVAQERADRVGPARRRRRRATKRAASPPTSRSAGMSLHTTAVPCAIASSTGIPKPSWRLGNTNRSAPANSAERARARHRARAAATRSPSRPRHRRVVVVGFQPSAAREHQPVRHVDSSRRRTRRAAPARSCGAGTCRPRTRTAGRRSRTLRATRVDVARRWRAPRSTPLGTTRMRSRGIGVCAAISSARELRHRDHEPRALRRRREAACGGTTARDAWSPPAS